MSDEPSVLLIGIHGTLFVALSEQVEKALGKGLRVSSYRRPHDEGHPRLQLVGGWRPRQFDLIVIEGCVVLEDDEEIIGASRFRVPKWLVGDIVGRSGVSLKIYITPTSHAPMMRRLVQRLGGPSTVLMKEMVVDTPTDAIEWIKMAWVKWQDGRDLHNPSDPDPGSWWE